MTCAPAVIPAKAVTHEHCALRVLGSLRSWVPASAGMTHKRETPA
jgi:hypothetical protein